MEGTSYLKAVAAVLFAAVCAYIGAWLFPSVSVSDQAVAVIAQSSVLTLTLEGIALREETVLSLPEKATLLTEDAGRVPAGARLAQLEDGSIVSVGKSAVFFTQCDGFERLSPPGDEILSAQELDLVVQSRPKQSSIEQVRLVEGFYWYYAAFAQSHAPTLEKGAYKLKFEGFDRYTDAALLSVDKAEDGRQALLFRLRLGESDYLKLRKCTAELIVPAF